MSVLSLALAKTHLNITVSTYDAELQTVIDSAESMLGRLVGPLQATTKTSRVYPYGGCTLVLPTCPVVSLTSVTPYSGGALTLSDLHLNTDAGTITYNTGVGTFPAQWYDVVYSAGRSTCPDDLLLAVKELVRHLWTTQRGGTTRPGPAPLEGQVAGAGYLMPYRVQELIAPHLAPGFA